MSTATFTPIAEGSAATPGLWNSRLQELADSASSFSGYVKFVNVNNVGGFQTNIGETIMSFGTGATPTLGFFVSSGTVRQTGVAVSAASIHAVLVAYGLITA